MRDHFKFKIYHKSLKKSFFVTSIDYKNNIVCYENGDKTLEVSFGNIIMLMPTGIYDSKNNEIYEGDVIIYQENSFTYKKTSQVIYENGCFIAKQILSGNIEQIAFDENMYIDKFKDLLYLTTFANYKPVKIIGNIFTYKLSKNNSKIKISAKI